MDEVKKMYGWVKNLVWFCRWYKSVSMGLANGSLIRCNMQSVNMQNVYFIYFFGLNIDLEKWLTSTNKTSSWGFGIWRVVNLRLFTIWSNK